MIANDVATSQEVTCEPRGRSGFAQLPWVSPASNNQGTVAVILYLLPLVFVSVFLCIGIAEVAGFHSTTYERAIVIDKLRWEPTQGHSGWQVTAEVSGVASVLEVSPSLFYELESGACVTVLMHRGRISGIVFATEVVAECS